MDIKKHPVQLQASLNAVITLFLNLPDQERIHQIISRIAKLDDHEVSRCLDWVIKHFDKRHRDTRGVFQEHFQQLIELSGETGKNLSAISAARKLLTGAFFTKEYSIESAALFNPSIVTHSDQQGLKDGELRFLMSLRATGEGHISSVVFQAGILDREGNISLEPPAAYHTRMQKNKDARYDKQFFQLRSAANRGFDGRVFDRLPESFTASEANDIFKGIPDPERTLSDSILMMQEMLDSNYELTDRQATPINEKVIFPVSQAESMGMEDLRLVRFEDKGQRIYYGTYTAYNGKQIRTQLLETRDFQVFNIRTLYGPGIADKGMALFPEKVDNKYVMISRQGGEHISIMFSEDLYHWENPELLMEPKYPWELLQLGNCGSPVKTAKGWLLLTHGVGAMRTYVISAVLLDLANPRRIIGRLERPMLEADESEREGYVPNVVYTCGMILHRDQLIIPYAVSDSATRFASIKLDELLSQFKL
jgi:predicted GH43/DUF377 family glycosyl hydrolase